ncbi:WD40 repeat domain-containing protein [Frigoriglobus tundricola]|nr:WD40 repeat domain-containing protein [Frigoriglobus tundricola]
MLSFSPDGRYLAAGNDRRHRPVYHLWNPSAGPEPVRSWAGRFGLPFLVFTPGGVTVGGLFDPFFRYDIRTGERTAVSFPTAFWPHHFSPDGRFAICSGGDAGAGVYRLHCARADGRGWTEAWQTAIAYNPDHVFDGYGFPGYDDFGFSVDGGRLLCIYRCVDRVRGTRPIAVDVFALDTGERVGEWVGELPRLAVLWTVDPMGVAVFVTRRAFYAVDTANPRSKPVKRLNTSAKDFTDFVFSRDGRWLATTSNDTAATIWDTTTWKPRRRFQWNIGRLQTVAFAPDGLRCAAAGDAGRIVVWDLDD